MPRWDTQKRKEQSLCCALQRPWKRSSGPKTPEGKAKVAANALKHGMRSRQVIEEIHRVRKFIRTMSVFESNARERV